MSKNNICRCRTKILYRRLRHYRISSFLVWVAPKLLYTNVVNVPLLVSITQRNICSRFISFRIICFNLNSSSNKKNNQPEKHKKGFCRTKASDYGDLQHQGVTENELGVLSCITHYLSCICEN